MVNLQCFHSLPPCTVSPRRPHLIDMADHPDGYDLSLEQALIVVCSTQGDGVPPSEAREFCEWLFSGKAGPLAHMAYSVCALGDRAYTHFCRCGRQVDAALQGAGAQPMAARVDVNREDWGAVDAWISAVVQALTRMELKSMAETGGELRGWDGRHAASFCGVL
jgi:sulfite reductase (NADPH) flavoprotein alpha-component